MPREKTFAQQKHMKYAQTTVLIFKHNVEADNVHKISIDRTVITVIL